MTVVVKAGRLLVTQADYDRLAIAVANLYAAMWRQYQQQTAVAEVDTPPERDQTTNVGAHP